MEIQLLTLFKSVMMVQTITMLMAATIIASSLSVVTIGKIPMKVVMMEIAKMETVVQVIALL